MQSVTKQIDGTLILDQVSLSVGASQIVVSRPDSF